MQKKGVKRAVLSSPLTMNKTPKVRLIYVIYSLLLFVSLYSQSMAKVKRSILINALPTDADLIFVSNRDTGSRRTEIYAISVDGSNVTRITDSSYHHFISAVDPTKRYILTSRAEEDTNEPSGLGDEDKRSLWIIDLELMQETRLTDPADHAEGDSFSPDGYWIVFHMIKSGQTTSDLYKIRINGTQLTQLTQTTDAVESDPSWSPDGEKIVFDYLDADPGRFVLKTMNTDGTNIQDLYDGGPGVSTPAFPAGNYDPSWSPDGQWVVFERAVSSNNENWGNGIWHIYKVRADGTDITDLSQAGGHTTWAEFLPSFSPDGNFIIFSAYYEAGNPVNSLDDVLVMDTNGSSVMRVTTSGYSDKYPAWIPTQGPQDRTVNVNDGTVRIQGGEKGYVNPAKGEEALIYFNATGTGMVEVTIFTTSGALVWQIEQTTNGDEDFITWNCQNSDNAQVSSGVYIAHIKAPGIDT
ncbi:MAG: T9SS type A sorting domain-containing protein, partial [Elusimicrobia bacterium]|nr:T9SS type A sorting domain-containing protein [Elusimicrobiota bacterium]